MQGHSKVTSADVKNFAHSLLLKNLGFVSLTRFTPVETLIDMLLLAATSRSSIEQIAKESEISPSGKTIREHIKKQIPSLQLLENRLNSSLSSTFSKIFYKQSVPVAVDLFEIGYYGKVDDEKQDAVRRILRKNGTSRCHAYATAYSMRKGKRFTLAIIFVKKGETMLSVLKRLNKRLSQLQIRQEYFLLDRGFYSVDVMRFLIRYEKAFIIPVKINGKILEKLSKSKNSHRTTYKITNPEGHSLNLPLAIHCFNKRKKGEKKGSRKAFLYVAWGFDKKGTKWIKETYRKRFGIEVSHRQRNEMKIETCSRDEKVRYLYVGIGFILRNVWVWFHLEVFSSKQRGPGGKRLNLALFSVERLKSWIKSDLESHYGKVTKLDVPFLQAREILDFR